MAEVNDVAEDPEGRGPRCLCGHYKSEHSISGIGRCNGAYETLRVDENDHEVVEVACPCSQFSAADPNWHYVRS